MDRRVAKGVSKHQGEGEGDKWRLGRGAVGGGVEGGEGSGEGSDEVM